MDTRKLVNKSVIESAIENLKRLNHENLMKHALLNEIKEKALNSLDDDSNLKPDQANELISMILTNIDGMLPTYLEISNNDFRVGKTCDHLDESLKGNQDHVFNIWQKN